MKGRRSCINTFESILGRLRDSFTGQASTLEGSVAGDILHAVANELARIYSQELAPAEDNLFLTTAQGEHLDALCGNYSITRQEDESDDSLRERALLQVRQPAMAGNAAHYKAWAQEIDGVRIAQALAGVRGTGTVDVYYVPEAEPPEDLWETLQAHLEARCPLGAEVLAMEAMAYDITVAGVVELRDTALLSQVQSAFSAATEQYFSQVALTEEGTRVSPRRLSALLLDCAGVWDVTALTVADRDVTLELPAGTYPRLAQLTLEQVITDEQAS